jgi:hypothetical protein
MIKEINLKIVLSNSSDISSLIGKSFKKNKYGKSIWTDEIKYVGYKNNIIDRFTKTVEIYVIGKNSPNHFPLDEILIVNEKPHMLDNGFKSFNFKENFKKEE